MSVFVLLLLVSGSLLASGAVKRSEESEAGGASVNGKAAEHWLPFMFMMNNSQTVQSPATWMLGAVCLGVTMFLRNGVFNVNYV